MIQGLGFCSRDSSSRWNTKKRAKITKKSCLLLHYHKLLYYHSRDSSRQLRHGLGVHWWVRAARLPPWGPLVPCPVCLSHIPINNFHCIMIRGREKILNRGKKYWTCEDRIGSWKHPWSWYNELTLMTLSSQLFFTHHSSLTHHSLLTPDHDHSSSLTLHSSLTHHSSSLITDLDSAGLTFKVYLESLWRT